MIVEPGARLMSKYLRGAPPSHWMAAVCDMNFDQDIHRELLRWIIQHRSCEQAVALAAYWYLGPRWYAQFPDRDSLGSSEERTTFDLLREIEQRYERNFYRNGNIGFDPGNDVFGSESYTRGYDWTTDYADRPLARPIPVLMLRAIPGEKIFSSAPELGTWIEGLPEHLWNAADNSSGSRIGNATIIFSLICNTITGHVPSLKTI
jgi:hypothetical protein